VDSRTKKTVCIASILLIAIGALSLLYSVSITKAFELKSGAYFCKIDITGEGNARIYKWDIGVAENNMKSDIVQTVSNEKTLDKFKDTVGDVTKKRLELFLAIIYLLFVLIIFATVQKDRQIMKSNKRFFQLFTAFLVVFLICIISISFVELNQLYKDINYYYSLI